MKIKIAITDDHPLVIAGIQFLLSSEDDLQIVNSYANGDELMNGLATSRPDVLLLDIQMPGKTGDEIAELVLRQYPGIKIIALTNQDNIYYIKTMLRKGVLGYVLKTAPEEVLHQAIRTVYSGDIFLDPSLRNRFDADEPSNKRATSLVPVLTRREKEVLQLLTRNLTSQQIADELNISRKTVESHRQSLLIKLDVKNVAALIMKGIQLGFIQ